MADKPRRAGTSFQEILSQQGIDINDTEAIESYARSRGYSEAFTRKAIRGARQYAKKKNGRDFHFTEGGDSFRIYDQAGQEVTKTGRGSGNKKGFNLGDLVGVGNNVSAFAGLVQDVKSVNDSDDKELSKTINTEADNVAREAINSTIGTEEVSVPKKSQRTSLNTDARSRAAQSAPVGDNTFTSVPSPVTDEASFDFPFEDEVDDGFVPQDVPSTLEGLHRGDNDGFANTPTGVSSGVRKKIAKKRRGSSVTDQYMRSGGIGISGSDGDAVASFFANINKPIYNTRTGFINGSNNQVVDTQK